MQINNLLIFDEIVILANDYKLINKCELERVTGMDNNIVIDSTEQIISAITDSISYTGTVSLVDTLTIDYTPFLSYNLDQNKIVSSIADLFGSSALIHSDTHIEPLLADTSVFNFFPFIQYVLVLLTLIFASLIICKFSEYVGRLFKLTFSFPHLYRQLESANNAIDTMAHYVSVIVIFLLPLIYFSFNEYHSIDFLEHSTIMQFFVGFALVAGVYLYDKILKYIFCRVFNNRYFYRRLFIAERICISSYTLILLPLILLASVPNLYHDILIKVQFLIALLFCIHYLVTDLKLFIEEKVSYIQLILYFCSVKVVVIALIIYFGILWL